MWVLGLKSRFSRKAEVLLAVELPLALQKSFLMLKHFPCLTSMNRDNKHPELILLANGPLQNFSTCKTKFSYFTLAVQE